MGLTTCTLTKEEAKKYFHKCHYYSSAGELINGEMGYICRRDTRERTYFLKVNIYIEKDMLCMDLYPNIFCAPAYRDMFLGYITQLNDGFENATIMLDYKGTVYIRTEKSFKDSPLYQNDFLQMEHYGYMCIQNNMDNLERVSHGLLPIHDDRYEDGEGYCSFFDEINEELNGELEYELAREREQNTNAEVNTTDNLDEETESLPFEKQEKKDISEECISMVEFEKKLRKENTEIPDSAD